MKQYNANILLVDQDHNYRTSLCNALSDCGYSVHETETAGEAIQHLQDYSNYDLVIWVPLSPAEILSFLEALREETSCPVLAVFRELSSEHRLTAYASGADDCIQTSISEEEMLAKVTALLRRYNEYRGKVISAYSVHFNPEARIVMKNGKKLDLTDLELNILEYLYNKNGEVASIPEIYEQVWGEKYFPGSNNAVMVHILNLRKKIEENMSHPTIIRTVWGKGYRLCL